MRRYFKLATEDIDVIPAVVETNISVDPKTVEADIDFDSPESIIVYGDTKEDDLLEMIDEAEVVLESMESVKLIVSENVLDKMSSDILTVSLEHMYSNVGISEKVVPTLEGISDAIKTVKDSIVEAVKRLIKWFKDIYNKIFDKTDSIKNDAEKLKEELLKRKNVATEWIDDPHAFEDDYLFLCLQRDGKCDNIPRDAEQLYKLAKVVLKPADMTVDSLIDSFKSGNKEAIKNIVNNIIAGSNNTELNNSLHPITNPDEDGFNSSSNIELKRSNELLGGAAIIKKIPKTDETSSVTFNSVKDKLAIFSLKVDKYSPKKSHTVTAKPFKVVDISEIVALTTTVIDIMTLVHEYKDKANKIQKAERDIYEACHKVDSVAAVLIKILFQPQESFNRYLVKTCAQLMLFAKRCSSRID